MKIHYSTWVKEAVFHGSTKGKQVSLTFDDGPHPKNLIKILDTLDENQIQGTFFWIVDHALKLYKEDSLLFKLCMKRIKNGQHSVGFHAPYEYLPTPASFLFGKFSREEFETGLHQLEKLTKVKIEFYRPHRFQYGSSIIFAKENGLKTIIGMFPSPLLPSVEQTRRFSLAKPGDILIFHERDNINRILPQVIQNLKSKGFKYSNLNQFIK